MSWGGKREGAGRPKKEGEVRKMRAMRATNHEWELIQKFAKIIKKGNLPQAESFLNQFGI